MFSGEVDVLGDCLKDMASKEGIQVEVYSLDRKGEGDVDLAKDHPFLEGEARFGRRTRRLSLQHVQQGEMEHGLQRTAAGKVTATHLWVAFELGGGAAAGRCGDPTSVKVGGSHRGHPEEPEEAQGTTVRNLRKPSWDRDTRRRTGLGAPRNQSVHGSV